MILDPIVAYKHYPHVFGALARGHVLIAIYLDVLDSCRSRHFGGLLVVEAILDAYNIIRAVWILVRVSHFLVYNLASMGA